MPCGFALVIAFVLFSRPDAYSLACGLPVSVIGLLIRAWAAQRTLRSDSATITHVPERGVSRSGAVGRKRQTDSTFKFCARRIVSFEWGHALGGRGKID